MLPIAKKFLGAALIYLLLGLLVQMVNAFDVWLGFNPLAYTAVVATQQFLLLGWLTQLGLALAYNYWLSSAASTKPAQLVFIMFNIGLPLVIAGQPGLALLGGQWLGAVAAVGGLLQFLAGLLFIHEATHTLRKN